MHSERKSTGFFLTFWVLVALRSVASVSCYWLTFDLLSLPREAINRLCDIVPGGKGAWRKKVNAHFACVITLLLLNTELNK